MAPTFSLLLVSLTPSVLALEPAQRDTALVAPAAADARVNTTGAIVNATDAQTSAVSETYSVIFGTAHAQQAIDNGVNPPQCPSSAAWNAAMNSGNAGELDRLSGQACGRSSFNPQYRAFARGQGCMKWCFTCLEGGNAVHACNGGSHDSSWNNVRPCFNATICRYDYSSNSPSSTCMTHQGSDTSGTCNANAYDPNS
jgi:hypothetical protein